MQVKAEGNASYLKVSSGTSQTAGVPFTVTVTAYFANGSIVTGYVGKVNFTSSDTGTGVILPSNYTFTADNAGIATFQVTLVTAGSQSITVTDTSNSSVTGSENGITVGLATPTLASTAPADAIAGVGFTDSSVLTGTSGGNAGGTVTYTLYSGTYPSGTQVGSSSVATVTGGVVPNSTPFTVTVAGSYYFTTVYSGDPNNNPAQSNPETFAVNAASLSKFVLGAPSSAIAGSPFTLTVTVEDAYGNIITSYGSSVGLSASSGTISPTSTGTSGWSSGVWSNDLASLTAAGTITVTASANSVTGTASLAVNPGAATIFVVSGFPSPIVAGVANIVTVTAYDAYGNVATSYTGTVAITSSDSNAVLPASAGLKSGSVSFSVTLKTAGTQTITATDTEVKSITGSQTGITVDAGPLATLSVSGPASVTAGETATFTAMGYDAEGNSLGAQTASWSITIGAGGSWVQSTGTYTSQTAGSWTVQDSVSGITGVASLTVNPGAATLLLVSSGTSQVAGTPFTMTVKAEDAYGNTATTYTGTIHFTTSDTDSNVVLPPNYTFLPGDLGTYSFSDGATLITIGTQSVTATDTTTSSITGSQTGITVTAASGVHFVVSGFPSSATAGTPYSLTVTAEDPYGNVDASYAGKVTFTSSDSKATLPANSTLTDGVGTFTVTLETAGIQSITATDNSVSSVTGSENGISVIHAAAVANVAISPVNLSVMAGASVSYSATASDLYGNTWNVTSSTTWNINSDAAGSWSSNVYNSANAGSWTITGIFNGLSYTAGLTVDPAGLDHFAFTTVANQTVDSAFSITIIALDTYGNIATGYSGTPTLSLSAGTINPTSTDAFSDGTWTGTVNINSAGFDVTIEATEGSYSGASNAFMVNPTVSASAGAGGSISPSGIVSVNFGATQTFYITASLGYSIEDVLVNGSSVGAVNSYTFDNVKGECTISATFTSTTSPTPVSTPAQTASPSPARIETPWPTSVWSPNPTPSSNKSQALGTPLEVVLVVVMAVAGLVMVLTVILVVPLRRKPDEMQEAESFNLS
jgi:hypothetical protein